MTRIRVNIRPPNGWEFVEKDGTKLVTGSWRGIIKKVKHYRLLNHFPPGEPEREVTAQNCRRAPSLCYDDVGTWTPPKNPGVSLKSRVLKWMTDLSRVTPVYVSPAEAARRAEICLRCKDHGPMEGGCASCKSAVKELEKANLRGRYGDPRLACCSILGQDLKVSTWISDDHLNDPAIPSHCWRKAR